MIFTKDDLMNHATVCNDGKGSSYTPNDKKATKALYNAMVHAMSYGRIETAKSRKDFSLGHIGEGLHNAILSGSKDAIFAFAYQADYTDENGSTVEIKVSANSKDLCTPVIKPITVHLLTVHGWVSIDKAIIAEMLNNPTDYADYAKVAKGKGLRLKVNAYKLGLPISALNKAFGF
jgi:hypothetical protein